MLCMERAPADLPKLVCLGDAHVAGHGSALRHVPDFWAGNIELFTAGKQMLTVLQLGVTDLGGQVIK